MTRASKLLGATGLSVLAALGATPAFAAGTAANTSITNTATIAYTVGGVAQVDLSASDTFKVDRKVNVTVVTNDTTTVQVAPGQTSAVTTFTVTNNSNATLDFALSAAQLSGGLAGHSNTDTFDGTNLRYFVETDGVAGYSAGDTATFIDELGADQSKTVYVLLDIPNNAANNGVAGVVLTATGRENGTAGLGATLTQATTNGALTVETVFADVAGATDANRDAAHSAKDDYTVGAAALTATKTSLVISDPFNGTSNPKAIPGAVIQYCIAVANGTGGQPANAVTVGDLVPSTLTVDTAYGVKVGGTVTTGGVCNTDGAIAGTAVGNTVAGVIPTLTAGQTRTVLFRATVN